MPQPETVDIVQATGNATEYANADHAHDIQGQPQGQEQKTQAPATKMYSEQEFQSEIDRRVSKALEKVRQDAEIEKMKLQGQWKELYEQVESRAKKAELQSQAQKILTQKQLPELSELFLADLNNVDNLAKVADALNSIVEARVQKVVEARLETGKPVVNAAPRKSFTDMSIEEIASAVKNMTPEEYANFKKEKGIY